MTTLVQMNTRIDGDLKAKGDAVFESIGYSPTNVVRCVWEYAQNHAGDPEAVKRTLDELAGPEADASEVRAARRAKMSELSDLRNAICAQWGIDSSTFGTSSCGVVSNREIHEISLETRRGKYGVGL